MRLVYWIRQAVRFCVRPAGGTLATDSTAASSGVRTAEFTITDEDQKAEAVLARLAGGVLCYRCGGICESKLGGDIVYWCETCRLAWMGVTLTDPSLLNLGPDSTIDFKITLQTGK